MELIKNYMSSTITYNSYNLQTANIITEKILHTSAPSNEVLLQRKVRRDGSVLMSNYWTQKRIQLTGHILGSSVSDLDSKIDTLKQNLVGENQNLDIGYAGGTRRYIATLDSLTIDREHFHTSWVPFALEFICADPFGRATSSTQETLTGQTSSPFTKVFTMGGSIGAYPVITLDFTTGDNVTAVKIENETTGDYITITRSFSNGESLEVDCDNLTVEVDSSAVDFTGVFPEFVVGSNSLKITVTGTPFDIDLDITYTNLYL